METLGIRISQVLGKVALRILVVHIQAEYLEEACFSMSHLPCEMYILFSILASSV